MLVSGRTCAIAAVQTTPVFLDRDATIEKACRLIGEAGARGAQLVVFPEAFVPGYPDWVWTLPPSDGALDDLYTSLVGNAVTVPSDATDALCAAARAAGAWVVIGINERNSEASGASVYNALLFIDDGGNIAGRHRKLIPTSAERTVWAQGRGDSLRCYDTPVGRLGGLICWENYMPLARQALYDQGVQILAAPTWDQSDTWLCSLQHIAKEGGCYVVGCCMALRVGDIPDSFSFKSRYGRADDEWINPGKSAIVAPGGEIIAGPGLAGEEILTAEVDARRLVSWKRMLDVSGHYARPDIFRLTVHGERPGSTNAIGVSRHASESRHATMPAEPDGAGSAVEGPDTLRDVAARAV